MGDGELLIAIRAGDRDAWTQLVRRHSQRLWAIARSQNLDSHAATDVVQTVWLTLLDHLERIDRPDSVGAWMTTVAKREAWRLARLGRMQVSTEVLTDAALISADLGDLQPERAGVTAASMHEVSAAIAQLSDEEALLLKLRYGSAQLSQQELAEVLDRPIGSIGPTLLRCIDKVRRILNEGATAATAQREATQ